MTDRTRQPRPDVGEVGQRVEALLDRIGTMDAQAARTADELVRALVGLYGAGLAHVVDVLRDRAPEVLDELADDLLVAGLFSVHDLHTRSLHARVQTALDDVRPFLGSHGGDVTLVGVDDDVVRLRLEGACNGCGSSEATLEHAVEGAIRRAAPEVDRIDVEGVASPPAHADGLIPLASLLRCPTEVEGLAAEAAP